MTARILPLDTVLLLFLSTAFLVTAGAVGGNLKAVGTGLLVAYLVISHLDARDAPWHMSRRTYVVKLSLLLAIVAVLVVIPTLASILVRHGQGPETNAHDGVLQIEAAIHFLLRGENPYAATYEQTPLAEWNWGHPYPNPALYYLAYLPFMFLAGIPLHMIFSATLGWYDQRFLYLMALAAALWSWGAVARDRTSSLATLAVIALSPLAAPYFIEGRNDIMVIALLGLSVWALQHPHRGWSLPACGIFFGVACATKQSVWFLGPFYLLYLRKSQGELRPVMRRWVAPGAVTGALVILPFFLWSPGAFVEDTVSYLSGNVEHNYPIKTQNAYGLHVLLASPRFSSLLDQVSSGPLDFLRPMMDGLRIRSELQGYPFWVFQLLFALPVFVLCLLRQARKNSLSAALAGYAVSLLTYQFFSRFLHDNYVGFVLTIWLLSLLVQEPPPIASSPAQDQTAIRRTADGVRGSR